MQGPRQILPGHVSEQMCPANQKPHPDVMPQCCDHTSNRGSSSGFGGNHTYCNLPVSRSSEVSSRSFLAARGGDRLPQRILLPPVFPFLGLKEEIQVRRQAFREPFLRPQSTGRFTMLLMCLLYTVPSPHCLRAKKVTTSGKVCGGKMKNSELLDSSWQDE